jgi:hypothetical protein
MNKLQKRLFGTAGVLAIAGIAAYWYWSPYVVAHQMRTAAIDADADSFNEHVDYPQLRESLKGQLSARITGDLASRSGSGNPIEQAGSALGSMLGLALVDRMVDAVVRPEMVMRAMQHGRFQLQNGRQQEPTQEKDREGATEPAPDKQKASWHVERKGVDTVFIHVDDDATPKKSGPAFVMRRDGFANWKLTEIRLPE